MGHRHDDRGGRGSDTEADMVDQIVVYNRCTCSCGEEWNEVKSTRPKD